MHASPHSQDRLSDGVVPITDGRITAVGTSGQVTIPGLATRIDTSGKFVIPGLMDANLHLFLNLDLETLNEYEGGYHETTLEAAQIALKTGQTKGEVMRAFVDRSVERLIEGVMGTATAPWPRWWCSDTMSWNVDAWADVQGRAENTGSEHDLEAPNQVPGESRGGDGSGRRLGMLCGPIV